MTEPKFFYAIQKNNYIYFNELLPEGYRIAHLLISLLDDIAANDDCLAFAFELNEDETGSEFVAKNIADENNYSLEDRACEKLIEAYNEYFDIDEPALRPSGPR